MLAGVLLTLGCVNQQNLTEEEKEEYRRARRIYDAGQSP